MTELSWFGKLYRAYYGFKFYLLRKERRERQASGTRKGFVGVQIDGLSAPHLRRALDLGYMPHIRRHLDDGHVLLEYQAGLPSTTPAAQAAIFYGDSGGIPAFRWFERATGQLISCNDPDHVQHFREKLFHGKTGLLDGGSSYSNIIDGGAARSVFTVSSPHPQTLFGRFGGLRFMLLALLHPLRICRMIGATLVEYVTDSYERWHYRKTRPWRVSEGLFPLIRVLCNVVLRELQTLGVLADSYVGVPYIYTTYSGYDELGHHFGPGSQAALKSLRHTDKRIGEILRMIRHAAGADYQLVVLSDHGQTPGYPFHNRFGATLGDAISAFLKKNQRAAVSSGPLEFTAVQLDYLRAELDTHPSHWRNRIYRMTKKLLQNKIRDLVPETIKIDPEGGVVVTYSSSLAHLYITGHGHRLTAAEVEREQPLLLRFLSQHQGIGFVLARGEGSEIWCYHDGGRTVGSEECPPAPEELEFLRPYGAPETLWPRLVAFGLDDACGDLMLFGAYDGERIACFDDQVGGHGSVGGEQSRPFVILPNNHPLAGRNDLVGNNFLYHEVFKPLRNDPPSAPPSHI